MGVGAALVESPPGGPASWALGLRALAPAGLVDVVPAANTVLIRCDGDPALQAALARIDDIDPRAGGESSAEHVTIEVHYDGEDLDEVAAATGLDVGSVITMHSAAEYRVAFCGFAPGFGYLTGLPDQLQLPRRPTPRTRVPAGAVAIAAEYSAVYPRSSPGGWHLLGRTDRVLFDPEREPPAVLAPGAVVRFVAVA
jgi:KipI family sensor histidine kinase inhibitor